MLRSPGLQSRKRQRVRRKIRSYRRTVVKGVEKQEPVLTENERRNQTTGEERRVGNVVEEVGHVIYYGTSHFSDYWCRTNDDTAAPGGTHSPKATRALCCQGYEISEDPIFGRSTREHHRGSSKIAHCRWELLSAEALGK